MKRLLPLLLVACSGPGRPLEYTPEPVEPPTLQEQLNKALDSLKCLPPDCYPNPRPPAPSK